MKATARKKNVEVTEIDRAEAEARATNRTDMLRLQDTINLHTIRAALENLLWFGDSRQRPDGRKNQVPNYVFPLLLGLLRVFAVESTPEAKRKSYPYRFNGVWRRLPRKEIAMICGKSLKQRPSYYQVTKFLRLMDDWGVIDRSLEYDHKKNITVLHVKFNAARLIEIVENELPRAEVRNHDIVVAVKAEKQAVSDPVSDSNSEIDRSVINCACLVIDNNSSSFVPSSMKSQQDETNSELKKEEDRPSARSISSFSGNPDLVAAPPIRVYGGLDSATVPVSSEVAEIIRLLRTEFPGDQFTMSTIKRITKLTRASKGSYQLTSSRVARYQRLKAGAMSDETSFSFKDVNLFLACWRNVWTSCQQFTYQEKYMDGVEYLDGLKRVETQADTWLIQAALDLKVDASTQARLFGLTEGQAMLTARPNPAHSDNTCFEIARCIGLRDLALPLWEENKSMFKDKLHKAFEGNPTGFLAYQKSYPEIMEWAGVTEADVARATRQTLAAIEMAHSYVKVGRMWGLGDSVDC